MLARRLWSVLPTNDSSPRVGCGATAFVIGVGRRRTCAGAYPDFADIPYAPKGCKCFPAAPYMLQGLRSLMNPARYISPGRMSLRLMRTLLVPRYHVEAKGVFEQLAYMQKLSQCSGCAHANGRNRACGRANLFGADRAWAAAVAAG